MSEIVLLTGDVEAARAQVRAKVPILQEFGARIVLVEGTAADVDAALAGVSAARLDPSGPGAPGLSDGERLFVEASRSGEAKEERPHEGLNWGTKGFSAP